MRRLSTHVEPSGAAAIARHYLRDLVYGANDGIVTTFAVVSGVAGGALPDAAVLIVGAANLAADGVSMGVGNFLSIRADERAREMEQLPELEAYPWKHGVATVVAFVVAGVIPLLPYVLGAGGPRRPVWSAAATLATMFALGVARSAITGERWWRSGGETLALGALVAAAAYAAGAIAAAVGAAIL